MAVLYKELLKDPRWQKRRLEIFQRDEFSCQLCGDNKSTLHVHHKTYRQVNVWEYDDDELITYCELCHLIVEFFKKEKGSPEVLIIEKETSVINKQFINIFVLTKNNRNHNIAIFYFDKELLSLNFIVSMKKITVNRINDLVNEFSK